MLYSPQTGHEVADEGFEEFVGDNVKPTTDFSLFDHSHVASSLSSVNDTMFPPLATNYSGQYVNPLWASRAPQSQYGPSQLQLDDFMRVDEFEQ